MPDFLNAIISVEAHYYLFNYIIFPVILFLLIYLNHKYSILHGLFKRVINAIMSWALKIKLDRIDKMGNRAALNKLYIDNALLEAQSADKTRMKNGVQQLIQFYRDERVLKVLTDLIYREKNFHDKCFLVYALKEVCDRRLEDES